MANAQQLGPSAQKVLAYLQQHRGTPFAAGDMCEVVDCSTSEAQTALERLASAGMIERQQTAGGPVTYVAR
jgi:predicted transcriptional regulator